MSCPEHPVRPNDIKVAQPLTVEVLQHSDHFHRKFDQSVVSVGACHAGPVVDAVDALFEALSVDLFDDLLDDVDAVSGEVVDMLGAWLMESWLDKKNNAIIFSAPRYSHHRSFKH